MSEEEKKDEGVAPQETTTQQAEAQPQQEQQQQDVPAAAGAEADEASGEGQEATETAAPDAQETQEQQGHEQQQQQVQQEEEEGGEEAPTQEGQEQQRQEEAGETQVHEHQPATHESVRQDAAAAAAVAAEAEIPQADATLPIRFTARPEGFYTIKYFSPRAPVSTMYSRLESEFQVEKKSFRIYWDGRPLTDMDIIGDVCVIPDDGTPLMVDVEFDALPPHLHIVTPNEHATRSIGVHVEYGDDIPSKRFFVTLVKGFERKPFLGGYSHKKSTHVYHHATTQCQVEREIKRDLTGKLTRMTQTQGVTRSCQTRRECATQMPRSDLLVDETYDRVVVAKPYFSADKLNQLQIQKAIQLQAHLRGWRARSLANKLRDQRDHELAALATEDAHRKGEHHQKRLQEIERRTHPSTQKDFAVLYNELESWRLQEVARIKEADVPETEKKIAMQELLKKQTKLLQTIDRLQIQASKENKVKRIDKVLNKMSSAKNWGTASAVNVETPFTIRARELRDLYNGLHLTGLTVDERLDILLHVKWTVKEFECPLTREIVELVDREADLLNRGRKEKSLTSLRQRISNLFLQFIETPEFNPEAIQYQRVPIEFQARPLVRLDKR